MTTSLEIPANERGLLHLFALDQHLSTEIADSGVLDQLSQAMGICCLHDPDVQIVPLREITDMGLAAFLQQAYDIDPGEIAPKADTLKTLTGTVALLRSGAFNGQAVQLTATKQALLIATFTEPQPDWSAKPMPSTRLIRTSPRAARSRARRIGLSLFSGMVALILLLLLWLAT